MGEGTYIHEYDDSGEPHLAQCPECFGVTNLIFLGQNHVALGEEDNICDDVYKCTKCNIKFELRTICR